MEVAKGECSFHQKGGISFHKIESLKRVYLFSGPAESDQFSAELTISTVNRWFFSPGGRFPVLRDIRTCFHWPGFGIISDSGRAASASI